MQKALIKRFYLFAPALLFTITMVSCNSTKKIKYFQDIPDSGLVKQIPKVVYPPLIIQPGDNLTVTVSLLDNSTTGVLNSASTPSSTSSSSTGGTASLLSQLSGGNSSPSSSPSGYIVDKDGFIDMPILGKIKVSGDDLNQIKDKLSIEAAKYYKDAVIDVRITNFKVDVTGEVLKPGQYIMPDQKESIFDALSMAGDLTIFGKRENVLLVRENTDGTKTAYRINLKKSDILSSPLYYLRQNDLIYVEPRKAKSDATDAAQAKYFGIAAAVASILIIIATRTK